MRQHNARSLPETSSTRSTFARTTLQGIATCQSQQLLLQQRSHFMIVINHTAIGSWLGVTKRRRIVVQHRTGVAREGEQRPSPSSVGPHNRDNSLFLLAGREEGREIQTCWWTARLSSRRTLVTEQKAQVAESVLPLWASAAEFGKGVCYLLQLACIGWVAPRQGRRS